MDMEYINCLCYLYLIHSNIECLIVLQYLSLWNYSRDIFGVRIHQHYRKKCDANLLALKEGSSTVVL